LFNFYVNINQDCGYFKWDGEEDISITEKNMFLEEIVEDLLAKVEKMHMFVNRLKGVKEGSNMGGNEDCLLNKLKMLKE